MKTNFRKKLLSCSLILLQLTSVFPWQVLPVSATTQDSSSGNSESLDPGDKVTEKDLSKETQKQLEQAKETEKAPPKENKENPETTGIAPEISAQFQKESSVLDEIKAEALTQGREEVLEERSELSKTFVNPNTGIGETVLFATPIHEKDKNGNWQEPDTSFQAEKGNFVAETAQKSMTEVSVPQAVTAEKSVAISNEKTAVQIELPKATYSVTEVKDNQVLLKSDNANEPAVITTDTDNVQLAQYIDKDSDLSKLDFSLTLDKDSSAKYNQTTDSIEILKDDKVQEIISTPNLLNNEGDLIKSLGMSFDEKTNTLHVTGVQKETLEKVGRAKVVVRAMPVQEKTITGVDSTSIRAYDDTMSYYFQNYMMIGYDDGYTSGDLGAAHFQTYGILNIPNATFQSIARTHEIMSADLKLKRIGAPGFWGDNAKDGAGNIVNRLYEVAPITKDVGSFSSLTYQKFISQLGAPYGSPVNEDGKETYLGAIDVNNRWVDFDITNLANDWKNGVENHGVIIKNNKTTKHELPYAQAELFGGKGYADAEPYVKLTHRERPPIDKNMPLANTTLKLRPFVRSDNDGLVQFVALGLDGAGRPEAQITYRVKDKNDNNKVIYTGTEESIGRDYLFPNYPKLFDKANQYLELSSNWQTKDLLTTVLKENHLYQAEATITYNKNGKDEKADKTYDTFQLYKVSTQDTLPRLLAFYGLEKNRASFMRDNNMKDELLTQGNIVFIRNPQKNAGKAYTPKPLTDAEKIRLDSLAVGRGKHCQFGFEPINLGSGNLLYDTTDATWYDNEVRENFTRTYNAMLNGTDSPLGRNWTLNQTITLNQLADKSMMVTLADGGKIFFKRNADGSYTPEDTVNYTLRKVMETVKVDEEDVQKRTFVLEDKASQLTYTFDAMGQIRTVKNSNGQTKTYTYDAATGFLKTMKLFSGKTLSFKWDGNAHLTEATFPDGTKNQYGYNAAGDLIKVTDSLGKKFTYSYDSEHRMTSYSNDKGEVLYENEYDKAGRVTKQTDGEGNVVKLSYDKNTTTTTDANGNKTITTFNDHFQPTKIEYADGSTETNTYNAQYQLTEFVDKKGKKTAYTYDGHGNLTSTTYPDGTVASTTYNEWSLPVTETNRQGQTKTSTYDANGNLISLTDENGHATSYSYNAQGLKATETAADGKVKTFTYQDGNLTEVSDEKGLISRFTYDASGLLLTETDGNNRTKTYTRNSRGELIKETNFNGAERTATFDPEGNKLSETDYNGNKTSYTYNLIGQVIKETNAMGGSKTYTYDGNGNVASESDYLGNLTKMSYNSLNQRTEMTFPDGTKATYSYDKLGNLTKEILPDGKTTTFAYDVNNQLIKATDGLGNATTYERSTSGLPTQITYANGTQESFEYDAKDNLVKKTDKNGKVTIFTYNSVYNLEKIKDHDRDSSATFDVRGNRISTTNALGETEQLAFDAGGFIQQSTNADGQITTYETDGLGNVTKVIEPNGAVYQYGYDGNGNKTKEVAPDGTTTLYTYNALNLLSTKVNANGDIEQYAYDKNGNVTKKIDPMGNATTYTYTKTNELLTQTDALGNTSTLAYDEGGKLISFTDPIGRKTSYDYDKIGQLIKETTPMGVVTTYTYDSIGNLTEVKDSTNQKESYRYNTQGLMTEITDSQGRSEKTAYNLYGEKTSVTDIAGNTTTFDYDALSRLTKTTKPQGTSEVNHYDKQGNLIEVDKHNGGKVTYSYDTVGNLTKETNDKSETNEYHYNQNKQMIELIDSLNGKSTFKYDALGRVTETTDANGNVSKQVYDANGNIIKETDAEGNSTTHAYNALNQRLETVDAKGFKQTTTYDKAGRKVSESDFKGNNQTYTYDNANNITSTIDGLKRKASFTYDLRGQLLETVDSAKAKTSFTYNDDGTLKSETNAKGYIKEYAYDKLSQLTKTTDNVHEKALSELKYDKFGQLISETKSGKQTTTYAYDKVGRMTELVYPNKTKIGYSYDSLDRVDKLIDVRGNTTSMTYDGLGNVKALVAPNGAKTAYQYDGNGNLLKEIDPLQFATSFAYNKNNQTTQTTDAVGDITKQTYDSRNQVASLTDARNNTQKFDYDGNGNLTKQTDAKGKATIFAYDAANRMTQTTNRLGLNTQYTYDNQDNLTKIKDANGGTTSFDYSPTGELEKQVSANGKTETFSYRLDGQLSKNTKADGLAIVYGYDELNRLVGKRMKNQDFVYDYDDNNELTSAKVDNSFELGGIDNADIKAKLGESNTLSFERNAYGDITKATTSKGETVNYAYDAFGRQTEIKYPNGTHVKYEYDQKNQLTKVIDGDKVTSYTYDGLGRMTAVTSPEGTKSTYEYLPTGEIKLAKTVDPNGRRLSEQQYDYDDNGNLIKENLIYPKFKLEKTYEYDAENQLIKATEKESKTTRVTQYFYDNVGNRIATRLDVNGKYKGIQEWQNNADNQLLEITSDKGATYEYDANGHVSQKRSSLGEVTIYQYDVEGRLIQESSTWGKQTYYTYDALGNRISKGTATEYDRKLKTDMMSWMKATDREAQLRLEESDITLSDILTKLVKMPEFLSRCLPIKDRTWRIDHDVNRRKVTEEKLKKAVDTTVMIDTIEYLNDYTQTYVSPLQEQYTTYDKRVKSSYQATNFYNNKGMAIGNDLDTYHQDGLKSNITQISKENGRLYSSNLYKEFGSSERRIQDQAGYRSQYHDNSADIHLRAREYNTTTGRFLQQDTVLGDLETPVTQNKYVYANNNPFMYRDDAGRKAKKASGLFGEAAKIIATIAMTVVKVVKTAVENTLAAVEQTIAASHPAPNSKAYAFQKSLEASRLKREARKQKMCEEANDKIEEDVSSKYNLVKITDSPDEVYRKYIELSQKGIHPHTGKKISKEEAKKFQYAAWAGTITDFAGVVYGGYYASKGTVNIGSKSTGSKNTTSKGAKEAGENVPKTKPVAPPKIEAAKNIPVKSLDDLPDNVQGIYKKYDNSGWKGNVSGQTPGTKAGKTYENNESLLPKVDSNGKAISYEEFDVNNKISNQSRDKERFVRGNDGSIYYTNDHYSNGSFVKIK
ncbi:hypothetical protein FACS1894192_07390 [Bacilli bacterium]|nr:hypothetical protein FACS1894192_07390 [Bacilli bacterium]